MAGGDAAVSAINVNDSVTKSKFDNLYGCRESLVDGIKRATDVMIAGKIAVVVAASVRSAKAVRKSLRGLGATVWVTEIDPICALQAAMEGYRVVTMDDVAAMADIFVTATGNYECDHPCTHPGHERPGHRLQYRPFRFNEIDVASLRQYTWENIKPQVDHVIFPDGEAHHPAGPGATGEPGLRHRSPGFVMSNSFTNQVLAQIELWSRGDKYSKAVTRCRRNWTNRWHASTSERSARGSPN